MPRLRAAGVAVRWLHLQLKVVMCNVCCGVCCCLQALLAKGSILPVMRATEQHNKPFLTQASATTV